MMHLEVRVRERCQECSGQGWTEPTPGLTAECRQCEGIGHTEKWMPAEAFQARIKDHLIAMLEERGRSA